MNWLIFAGGFLAGQLAMFLVIFLWWAIRGANDDHDQRVAKELSKLWAELESKNETKP